MLGSFLSSYPTGSLLTELVQIYNGKYIVKASLQIEAVTRATAMAAAETLETAEDSARQRVITFFGGDAIQKEAHSESIITHQPLPVPLEEAKPVQASLSIDNSLHQNNGAIKHFETNLDTTLPVEIEKSDTFDFSAVSTNEDNNVPDETSVPDIQLPPVEEIVAPSKTKAKSKNTQQLRQYTELDSQAPDIPAISQVSEATELNGFKEPSFDTYDEFSPKEPLFEPLEPTIPTVNTLPNNVTPFTGRNYNPPEEIELPPVDIPAEVPTSASTTKRKKKTTDTTDQSDDIAKIGIEMQRLGWTTEQGRDYLIKQYNKRSRHLLTSDELRDFRQYLESQSTPDDPLAFDPIAGF
ncbi:hypothetical protein DSM106972_054240 [Dulcicalothrix desertica PCC 7102]|uniref:Uncharacterized protein n=1 Tax=Dulcicalothrix desertica PCC 7102 TaxID=232991 RepID=A0A3S1CGM1_9CYAN|nr:hypothetical protein [Dulcicalothrix desertica]RUT03116.1 hypothetical protein DSM106972_054240 [Dulcicalothrix desertica PCC 7102]TWH53491.1 hypothetical protein CAL7102_01445 [Dulcicalothrix desertica PCC 7102]